MQNSWVQQCNYQTLILGNYRQGSSLKGMLQSFTWCLLRFVETSHQQAGPVSTKRQKGGNNVCSFGDLWHTLCARHARNCNPLCPMPQKQSCIKTLLFFSLHLVVVPFMLPMTCMTAWPNNHQSGLFATCQDSRQATWPLLPAVAQQAMLLVSPHEGTAGWRSVYHDDWQLWQGEMHAPKIPPRKNTQASDLWISKAYLIQFQCLIFAVGGLPLWRFYWK